MKRTPRIYARVIPVIATILLLACVSHFRAAAQPVTMEAQHDPQRPYRAWAFCVDTTRSPTEEQFQKLLKVVATIVEQDITQNDLVWLIPIQSQRAVVQSFPMPVGSGRRSMRTEAQANLVAAKGALLSAIRQMKQASGSTDLQSAINAAITILRSHPQATERMLLIGSDFLKDSGSGQISQSPPPVVHDRSASGLTMLLLVTYPKPEYLRPMRMSDAQLYENVESQWAAYFKGKNASAVTVRPVDAVAISQDGTPRK